MRRGGRYVQFYQIRITRIAIFATLLSTLFLLVGMEIKPTQAVSGSHFEDFTTTANLDASNSNVTGWGSGAISIPKKNLTIVGSLNIPQITDLKIKGDYAYVLAHDLKIVNISDPTNPMIVSSFFLQLLGHTLFVDGNIAFITSYNVADYRLQIINITAPLNPTNISSYKFTEEAECIFVTGDYAYLGSGGGLQIVDISDPTTPTNASAIFTGGASDVFVAGDYAYVTGADGIHVVDISDPTNPSVVGSTLGYFFDGLRIFVDGIYAYIAGTSLGSAGIFVVDISDPTNPILVGSNIVGDFNSDITVEGNYAYIAQRDNGIRVFDITDPTNPILAGFYGVTDSTKIYVIGNLAYVIDWIWAYKILIIEISDPVPPVLVGTYDTPGQAFDVTIEGDRAYIADGTGGLQTVNISDPANPVYNGSYNTAGEAIDVFIWGDYAYVADGSSNTLYLIRINVAAPYHYSCTIGSSVYGVFVVGDYAYVAAGSGGLRVVDISNPTTPTLLGGAYTTTNATEVYIDGNYAYVTDESTGLHVVDISDPTSPTSAGSNSAFGQADGVFVDGDNLYIATSPGLRIVNITDTSNPTSLGDFWTTGRAWDVFAAGDYVYVADGPSGLQIVNVNDLSTPTNAGAYNTPGNALGVSVDGDFAFVADGTTGLQVIQVACNKRRQFNPVAAAQSNTIFSGSISGSLTQVTLSSSDSVPLDTNINYFLSPDNGLNWEPVTPGVEHTFINSGNNLIWKAILTTSNYSISPTILSISISYFSALNAPNLISPANGLVTGDNTPTFEWSSVTDAVNYLLQVDNEISFSLPLQINQTIGTTVHTPATALPDDVWYWRVAAIDSAGDIGSFTTFRNLEISTTPPIIQQPGDFSFPFGETGFSITWTVSDPRPDNYTVYRNNTIYETGFWTSSVTAWLIDLEEGTHNFTCVVENTLGFIASDEVLITVLPGLPDTVPPIITHPADITFEEGSIGYSISWTGSDSAPWWVIVERDGGIIHDQGWVGDDIIVSLDNLVAGTYDYNCTLYDEAGNSDSDNVIVVVTPLVPDTDPPIITTANPLVYEEGTVGNSLTWICKDDHPFAYSFILNESEVEYSPWHGENLTFNIDGLPVGVWIVNLTLWDLSGQWSSTTTTVTVIPPLPDTTNPFVSYPSELIIAVNRSGTIVWEVRDDHPDTYSIFQNNKGIINTEPWTTGIIQYHFISLPLGIWEFKLTLRDKAGNTISSSAIVKVLPESEVDRSPPQIAHPPDVQFVYGTTGNVIQIYLFDEHPEAYRIFVNEVLIVENPWNIHNKQVNFSLDGLTVGFYNVMITAWDIFGNYEWRTVDVVVVGDETPPLIISQPDFIVQEGQDVSIIWEVSDDTPSHFEIISLLNESLIKQGNWSGENIVLDLSIFLAGEYNFRIIVYDASDNYAIDDVVVRIQSSQGTPGFEVVSVFSIVIWIVALQLSQSNKRRKQK